MRALVRGIGRLAVFGSTLLFIAGVVMFALGSYLLTWPLHRLSPRNRRLRTIMDLFTALAAVAMAYQTADAPPEDAPNS